jgi:hypothetical protein
MHKKVLSTVILAGVMAAAGMPSASFAFRGGDIDGGNGGNPFVHVERERREDGSTVIRTYTPAGTTIEIRDADGKLISRRHRRPG